MGFYLNSKNPYTIFQDESKAIYSNFINQAAFDHREAKKYSEKRLQNYPKLRMIKRMNKSCASKMH